MVDDVAKGLRQAADLAKLDLTPEETVELTAQVAEILGYVEKINELDLDGVEATSHVRFMSQPLRKDEVVQRITKEDGMRNSPAGDEDFFIVPGILKGE